MKVIYLDNSATTACDLNVLKAMEPFFAKKFGNPSEPHFLGREALLAVVAARKQVANLLGADYQEIVFTGSATESINLSHKGLIEAIKSKDVTKKKLHLITSQIEHKAVLETCRHLENSGLVEMTYLPVDGFGKVSVKELQQSIREETALVSIMYVNNEVGTIQPLEEIGQLLQRINEQKTKNHKSKIYFHSDITQAVQYLDCDVNKLGVDFLSFTGHKIYAPKGIGALYIKRSTPIIRQMDGGRQELGFRAGTENVPYIVGLGKAAELIGELQEKEDKRLKKLQKRLISRVLKIPGVKLTGHPSERAPHIASFLVDGAEGESIVLLLSDKGIIASTGSACNSNELKPSHVLSAMKIRPEDSHGSIRFSLGRESTSEDINYVVKVLPGVIKKLREMAPKF